jgi:hypothetical protein
MLYYVGTNGTLKQYPLFTREQPTTIPLVLGAEESVNDFRVASGSIEYLGGLWCGKQAATCDLARYTYDMLAATTTLITEHVSEHSLTPTAANATTTSSLRLLGDLHEPGPNQFEGVVSARLGIALVD